MISLESILGRPTPPDEFHALIAKRMAPRAEVLRGQARLINEKFPQLKAEIILKADAALQGMLVLPGTGAKPYFVGNPPRWLDNPFEDDEYVWSLNRMFHWIPLLRAFSLTGDPRYAQKVVDELQDWIKSCPRPPITSVSHSDTSDPWQVLRRFNSADPWRTLETGIRMFASWPLILPHLLDTDFLTSSLLADYTASIFEHGEVLYHIAPQLWPHAEHNHYLMENLGLLELSVLFPEFSTAGPWKAHATHELERCAAKQITDEGGQIEGCPHYHNGCISWFVQALSTARAHGISFSPGFIAKLEKGIDYSVHSMRPSGTAVPWGDSDADTAVAIRSALSGFRLFHEPDYLQIAVNCFGAEKVRACCLETIWEDADTDDLLRAIDEAATAPKPVLLPTDLWEKGLDQVMLRTDWSHDALSVFFACRTPVNNGHAHIDPMGFDFAAHGRALVIDPGRFTYREDADRRDFKSAAYHNTLTINGRDPFEYTGSWGFGPQKLGKIVDVHLEPGCKAAFARHDNYEPTIHHRAVALIENVALLVVDWIENLKPDDLLQLYFHFDSVHVNCDQKTGRAETHDTGQTNVLLVPSVNFTGELLPGRVSDFIDVARPSTRLRLTASSSEKSSRVFATVLVPWASSSSRPEVSAPQITTVAGGLACTFEVNGRSLAFAWSQVRL